MKFFEKEYVEISCEGINNVVETVFKGYMSSEQFREAYDKIIDCCKEYKSSRTLCDCRKYVTIKPEDQLWLGEDWTPRLIQAGVVKTALILPDNMIQKQVIDKTTKTTAENSSVQSFSDYEEGLAWAKK